MTETKTRLNKIKARQDEKDQDEDKETVMERKEESEGVGYGTGRGDVGVREGGNLRPKTLIYWRNEILEDDILREERGRKREERRSGKP
jgi:hypothetical protein